MPFTRSVPVLTVHGLTVQLPGAYVSCEDSAHLLSLDHSHQSQQAVSFPCTHMELNMTAHYQVTVKYIYLYSPYHHTYKWYSLWVLQRIQQRKI